jgi:hypothetical protein
MTYMEWVVELYKGLPMLDYQIAKKLFIKNNLFKERVHNQVHHISPYSLIIDSFSIDLVVSMFFWLVYIESTLY